MTLPLILVTGATGTVGTEMIRHLVKAGHRVRALVRDRAKATKLGPKVELVVGDLDDPASLKPAFASVDEAFVVVNGKDLNRLEANAFDAAKSAGVSHIVKLSGRDVDWPSMHDTVLVPWHGESERRLKALGPSWTIPRPGFFASKLRSTIGCAAPTCGECRRPNSGCRRRIISSKIATERRPGEACSMGTTSALKMSPNGSGRRRSRGAFLCEGSLGSFSMQ